MAIYIISQPDRTCLIKIGLLLLLLCCFFTSVGQEKDYSIYQKKEVFEFSTKTTQVKVNLLIDKEGYKKYYTANLAGNVCLDKLCRPIDIDIYWDLLGNFEDYRTSPKNELTKFDHIEFTKEDHIKLREILADTNSLLRDYRIEDLIDPTVKRVSLIKIDAVTGATNPTFEDAIVPGAVYTVYELWHFVNSDIRKNILEYSKKNVFTDAEIKRLLLSGNNTYQYFLINDIPNNRVQNFEEELIILISDKDDYVPLYALSKLPDKIWNNKDFQIKVLSQLDKLKNPVRIIILENLLKRQLNTTALSNLIRVIPMLTTQQLQPAFGILKENKSLINKKLAQDIKELLNNKQETTREYANDFLMEL